MRHLLKRVAHPTPSQHLAALAPFLLPLTETIWGAVPNAPMKVAYPLAVYASVQKHSGWPLAFPWNVAAYDKLRVRSFRVGTLEVMNRSQEPCSSKAGH